MMKYIFALVLLAAAEPAFGGICMFTINREACPGKEQEAYAPYKGVNPTIEGERVRDAIKCEERAVVRSKILRKRIIKKITVQATYEGQTVPSQSASYFCDGVKK